MATLKANKDKARFVSNTISQDVVDGDWVDHEVITKYKLPEIVVDAETSSGWVDGINEKLVTTDVVAENDKVRLYDGSSVVEGSLGAITTTGAAGGAVDIHDIFGDGSAVATYKLDGNAIDLGGNYNGTWRGVEDYGVGKFGQGAINTNSSNAIYLPDTPVLALVHTLSWWMRDRSSGNSYNRSEFFGKNMMYTYANYFGYSWYGASSDLRLDFGDIDRTIWRHYVVTLDNGTANLYIDNILISTDSYTPKSENLKGLTIGAKAGSAYPNDSDFDQVRIFNKALTATEVTVLYNEEATKYTADISSFGLSTQPTKVYFDKIIDTTLSAEDTGSTNSTAVIGLTVNSATSTTANITLESGTMTTANSVVFNGKQFTPLTAVLDAGTTYDITFGDIGFTPDEGYIFLTGSTDIVPTVASDTFDGTDTFTKTYNKVTKTARDLKYGFVADADVEVIQLNINQNMED